MITTVKAVFLRGQLKWCYKAKTKPCFLYAFLLKPVGDIVEVLGKLCLCNGFNTILKAKPKHKCTQNMQPR